MRACPLDADWLRVWRHQTTTSLQRVLVSFEDTYGYPPGDNAIIPAHADSRSAAAQLKEHPAAAPALVAFYDAISEAALPDIDNGHFIHAPDHVLNDLAEYGSVRVADHVVGIVFASDGGGNLLAIDRGGAVHRSTTASWFDGFEPIATSLTEFLAQLQQAVADFADWTDFTESATDFADTGLPPERR